MGRPFGRLPTLLDQLHVVRPILCKCDCRGLFMEREKRGERAAILRVEIRISSNRNKKQAQSFGVPER
jgi:hypothetical protein